MIPLTEFTLVESRPGLYRVRIDGWCPTRVNELLRLNRFARKRRKGSDQTTLLVACSNAHVPKATGKRRVSVEWLVRSRAKKPDPDAIWKSLLDGLVAIGMLVDDHPKWCEIVSPTYGRVAEGHRRGIILTLEDV